MCVIQKETSIKVAFYFGQCPWLHSQGSGTSHIQPTFFKSYRGPWLLLLLPRTLAVAAAMLASFWHVYQPKRWREKIWAKALKNFHFTVKGSTLDPSGILWWETGGVEEQENQFFSKIRSVAVQTFIWHYMLMSCTDFRILYYLNIFTYF